MKLLIILLFSTMKLLSQNGEIKFPFPNETSIEKEKNSNEMEVIMPSKNSVLPNQSELTPAAPKKKKDEKVADPNFGPYPRGMYHLNRQDTNRAIVDLNLATSSEGSGNTNQAKLDVVRLLAKERKTGQAKSIVDGIEDIDTKYKAYFELASGLENSANTKQEREECIPLYLSIISEAPREAVTDKKSKDKTSDEGPVFNPLLPRTRWALANLLYRIGDLAPALDHLSRIIIDYPKSEFMDDALFLSGKIYEEGSIALPRDTKRALKYYNIFMRKKEQDPFKTSIYLNEVEKRVKQITPNLKPFSIQ